MVHSDFLGEALIGLTDSLRLDMHIEQVFIQVGVHLCRPCYVTHDVDCLRAC